MIDHVHIWQDWSFNLNAGVIETNEGDLASKYVPRCQLEKHIDRLGSIKIAVLEKMSFIHTGCNIPFILSIIKLISIIFLDIQCIGLNSIRLHMLLCFYYYYAIFLSVPIYMYVVKLMITDLILIYSPWLPVNPVCIGPYILV